MIYQSKDNFKQNNKPIIYISLFGQSNIFICRLFKKVKHTKPQHSTNTTPVPGSFGSPFSVGPWTVIYIISFLNQSFITINTLKGAKDFELKLQTQTQSISACVMQQSVYFSVCENKTITSILITCLIPSSWWYIIINS